MNFHYPANVEANNFHNTNAFERISYKKRWKLTVFQGNSQGNQGNSLKSPLKVKKFLFSKIHINDLRISPQIVDKAQRASSNPRFRKESLYIFFHKITNFHWKY